MVPSAYREYMAMDAPLEIIGEPPALAGAVIEELRCQQYWYRGELMETANVVFLRCDGVWYRFAIDCGVIFWRSAVAAPSSWTASEIDATYPVVDQGNELGVKGQVLDRYEMSAIEGVVQVELQFGTGRRIVFRNNGDRTVLVR